MYCGCGGIPSRAFPYFLAPPCELFSLRQDGFRSPADAKKLERFASRVVLIPRGNPYRIGAVIASVRFLRPCGDFLAKMRGTLRCPCYPLTSVSENWRACLATREPVRQLSESRNAGEGLNRYADFSQKPVRARSLLGRFLGTGSNGCFLRSGIRSAAIQCESSFPIHPQESTENPNTEWSNKAGSFRDSSLLSAWFKLEHAGENMGHTLNSFARNDTPASMTLACANPMCLCIVTFSSATPGILPFQIQAACGLLTFY